jgi:hypothetical protein
MYGLKAVPFKNLSFSAALEVRGYTKCSLYRSGADQFLALGDAQRGQD